MPTVITDVVARDIRFPTSRTLDGSDAMNAEPDCSAAYVRTDSPRGLEGHGFTFTIGRGNELCMAAVESLAPLVRGQGPGLVSRRPGCLLVHAGRRQPAPGGSAPKRASFI